MAGGEIALLDKTEWHQIVDHDLATLTGTCSRCGPVSLKMIKKKGTAYRYPTCATKTLEARAAKRQREKHTEEYLAYHRNYNRRVKYGLPPGGIEALMEAAGSMCEICQSRLTLDSARVDHDHACCSGKRACGKCVRGILCNACNTGLGLLKDDPGRLTAALAYLQRDR